MDVEVGTESRCWKVCNLMFNLSSSYIEESEFVYRSRYV